MTNQTMTRFGYPGTLISEYVNWVVLLREQQVTLGSLVLCAKSEATAFSGLSVEAFAEMSAVIADIEGVLRDAFDYDKINYLMLMMIDPNAHFHVIPRYATERSACGVTVIDKGWPAAPKLDSFHELSFSESDSLCGHLKEGWRRRMSV